MPIQHTDRVQNKTHQTSHTSGWEPRYLTWFMKASSKRPQLHLRSVAAVAGTYNNGFDNLVINSAALEKHAIDVVTPNGDTAAAASDLQGRTLRSVRKWNLSSETRAKSCSFTTALFSVSTEVPPQIID